MNLPTEDIETLIYLASLGGDSKNTIIETIESFKKEEPYKNVAKRLSNKLNIDNDIAEHFVSVFISLLRTREAYFEQLDAFVAYIVEDLDEDNFSEVDILTLKDFLTTLFNIKNKAPLIHAISYNLSRQNHNTYINSKIYDNLRPIILNNDVEGLVLYHTLKLHIQNDDQSHTDIFFAMDSDDINDMYDQLHEAKSRIESIKLKYGNDIIPI